MHALVSYLCTCQESMKKWIKACLIVAMEQKPTVFQGDSETSVL